MDASAKFWDRLADRYAKQAIADEPSYQRKLAITQQYLTPDSLVLEFGSGSGTTALKHAGLVQHYRATDISAQMVRIARDKAQAANIGNVSFEQANIEQMELPFEHYDAVLGMSILHLVADREVIINKVFKALKPGGVFVSSTVCLSGNMRLLKPVFAFAGTFGLVPKVQMFSQTQLKQSLQAQGFEPAEEFIPPNGRVIFLVMRKPG